MVFYLVVFSKQHKHGKHGIHPGVSKQKNVNMTYFVIKGTNKYYVSLLSNGNFFSDIIVVIRFRHKVSVLQNNKMYGSPLVYCEYCPV